MSVATFAHHDTSTDNKINLITRQIEIVNPVFPNGLEGYCVGLPGTALQCDRHVVEYINYGVQPQRQIFVDSDYWVHREHNTWKTKTKNPVTILYGDYHEALRKLWEKGLQIDVVDFDGTVYFQQYHEDLFRDAAAHHTKVIIIVVTTRRNTFDDYFEGWKRKLGLKKERKFPSRPLCNPVQKVTEGALKAIAKELGYSAHVEHYVGKNCGTDRRGQPMTAGIFINKKHIN